MSLRQLILAYFILDTCSLEEQIANVPDERLMPVRNSDNQDVTVAVVRRQVSSRCNRFGYPCIHDNDLRKKRGQPVCCNKGLCRCSWAGSNCRCGQASLFGHDPNGVARTAQGAGAAQPLATLFVCLFVWVVNGFVCGKWF
ncbi:hypothetical protein BsWGS_13273 [Bradybaena similaris]